MFHASQIACNASTNSRMRAAGRDHGMLNRRVMCGLICEPEPEEQATVRELLHVVRRRREGHRAPCERQRDPGAEPDAVGVLGREHERQERIVLGLRVEEGAVADLLGVPALSRTSTTSRPTLP